MDRAIPIAMTLMATLAAADPDTTVVQARLATSSLVASSAELGVRSWSAPIDVAELIAGGDVMRVGWSAAPASIAHLATRQDLESLDAIVEPALGVRIADVVRYGALHAAALHHVGTRLQAAIDLRGRIDRPAARAVAFAAGVPTFQLRDDRACRLGARIAIGVITPF